MRENRLALARDAEISLMLSKFVNQFGGWGH
jgi:hypothetical protein